MKVDLIGSTNNMRETADFLKYSQACGRQCYSGKGFEELKHEPYNQELVEGRLLRSGHHSVFEHINLTFSMSGLPKIMAMVLNNERQYATSEKSARYTQMKDINEHQKQLYDKWMRELYLTINHIYPKGMDEEVREGAIKKLAQENARYMTSVFTPTKMIHTVNLRQLNFIINEFERYVEQVDEDDVGIEDDSDAFKKGVAESMKEFLEQTDKYKIPGLENQTDRHLSLFRGRGRERYFGSTYSTNYLMSFAGLAQAHRHRTISYNMKNPELGSPEGFFIPEIVKFGGLVDEWVRDLSEVAEHDFPQAQLVNVNERGLLEDFRSKCLLRLCGHAQYEIMKNTLDTAVEYAGFVPEVTDWLKPKCQQGLTCNSNCVWTGKKALERIV